MRRLVRSALAAAGMAVAISLASCAAPGAPAVPAAVPAAAVAPPIPGAAVAVPAEPQGFFMRMCAQLDACRRKLCLTPAGQMLNSMTKPLAFATGGIVPPFCPIMPSAADLAKPGVAGAADAIKKDALEAKMRREKVRFLGTVDCRYYPDAIGALTAALRTDGSECVRFEAALALNRGCCCNQKTIDALEATVSGTDRDGNPAERSVRVRCAAASALERCLSCYVPPPVEVDVGPKVEPKPEPLPLPGEKKPIDATTAKKPDAKKGNPDTRMPSKESVERAWQTLNDFNALLAAEAPEAITPRSQSTSVFQIIKSAIDAPEVVDGTIVAQPAAGTLPPPLASDPGTPVFHAPTSRPAHVAPVKPRAEAAPQPPLNPIAGQPPRTHMPEEMPTPAPSTVPAAVPAAKEIPGALPQSVAPSAPAGVARIAPSAITNPPANVAGAAPSGEALPGASPLAPMINQLLHGSSPAERQAAVRQIAGHDWQKNPAVPSMLILGAKNDASPAVRVECIRQIATSQISHPQVILELEALTKDDDATVRSEAARALGQLKP